MVGSEGCDCFLCGRLLVNTSDACALMSPVMSDRGRLVMYVSVLDMVLSSCACGVCVVTVGGM